MSKRIVLIFLTAIILLAGALRFWQLGSVPISPDWDEAALGYNAYSLLHTGRDEYGVFLPIVLKSFGDYKPALYAYLDIPAVAVFGLNTFAVRFPSALLGTLTVVFVFLLIRELFKRNDMALLGSFLLAISPWHIQFSRVAFETNVGVFFNVLGTYLFLKGLKKPWLCILSVGIFALNLYVYQSEKIFTPLLFLLLCMLFRKEIVQLPKKYLFVAILYGVVLVSPIALYTLLSPNGLARAQGVSVFSSNSLYQSITSRYLFNKTMHDNLGLLLDNGRLLYIKQIIANYASHFSVNWLFITGDINRHHAPDMGLLYLWELPCMLIGIYTLFFGKFNVKIKLLIFGWFLLAPLPAAITSDVPHAVRTMNFLPIYQIFSALGILMILENVKKKRLLWSSAIIIFGVVVVGNFVYYLNQYFVQQNYFYASDWQYGFAQAVSYTVQVQKPYNQIVVDSTNAMSQSYMFYLFYLQYDPSLYQREASMNTLQTHRFDKYIFRPIIWMKDQHKSNTLFVGNAGDFPVPSEGSKKLIYTKDGKPLIEIVGT